MVRCLAVLVLAAPLLAADPPTSDKNLKMTRLAFDASSARFVAEGQAPKLADGTVLAGHLFLGAADGPWSRTEVRQGQFHLEFSTDGRAVLDGTYRVVVELRPEDQDPAAKLPAGKVGPVGLSTLVGIAKRGAEIEKEARTESFDVLEALHALAEEVARQSDAARPKPVTSKKPSGSASVKATKAPEVVGAVAIDTAPFEAWTAYAGPDGAAWTRFNELRKRVQDAEGSRFLSPAPQLEGPMGMVFGTLEKWFFSVWKDTCDAAHQPVPEEIHNLGGEPLPRRSVEDSLAPAVAAAYKAIGARGVAWRVSPDPKQTARR